MACVLVIDDEAGIRSLIRAQLERQGHEVLEAENGKLGVRLVGKRRPDVVLTDVFMPEQDGIETIQQLRRLAPQARLVAMSGGGRHGLDLLEIARELGAADTLRKPFRQPELLAALGL